MIILIGQVQSSGLLKPLSQPHRRSLLILISPLAPGQFSNSSALDLEHDEAAGGSNELVVSNNNNSSEISYTAEHVEE